MYYLAFYAIFYVNMSDPATQGRGDDLVERDGTNYFEKICLRGNIDQCRDKAWQVTSFSNRPSSFSPTLFEDYFGSSISLIHISSRAFERVPGKRLEGFDNKIIEQVQIVLSLKKIEVQIVPKISNDYQILNIAADIE